MVIKVDKSEEFKKSGKKLISEYEGAKWKEELWDENESNKNDNHDQINNGDETSKQKSIFEKFTDKLKTFLENAE